MPSASRRRWTTFTGDAGAAVQLKALGRILGLLERDSQVFLQGRAREGLTDAAIQGLINDRLSARKQKNYAEADKIRKDLEAAGIILEDSSQGTTWRRS